MAKLSAAQKIARSAERKRRFNRPIKSKVKSALSVAELTISAGDITAVADKVKAAITLLDKAKSKGVLHPNNVARRKSRLLQKYNAAVKASSEKPPPENLQV